MHPIKELQNEYKEVFKSNKDAKIQKCDFCKEYRVYPIHYKNENNETYQREYTKDKKKLKSICCMDCNQNAEMVVPQGEKAGTEVVASVPHTGTGLVPEDIFKT